MKKLLSILTNSFTADQPLRSTLAAYRDALAKKAEAEAEGQTRRRESKAAMEQLARAATKDGKVVTRIAEMDILAGVADLTAVQIDATLPGLLEIIDHEASALLIVLNAASRAVEPHLLVALEAAHRPWYEDEQLRERAVRQDHSSSDVVHSFSASGVGRYGMGVLEYADRALANFEQFATSLKKHAALFPSGFAPLPATEEEFRGLAPAYQPKPQPEPVDHAAEEEQRATIESTLRIERFREAQRRGDRYEEDRVWSGFLTAREKATILHEDLAIELPLDGITAFIHVNSGGSYHDTRSKLEVEIANLAAKPKTQSGANKHDEELSPEELARIEAEHAPVKLD